jgi:hypothetical protein
VKEQFRNWKFKGNISVKYTDANDNAGIWQKDQKELLSQVVSIVSSFMHKGIKLTNRQLYYQLVAANIIPNTDKIYKRVCTFITDARYAGLIDWSAIEDRGRVPEKHAEWNNVSELIDSAIYSYRLPRWSDQDNYVELFCEKEAMGSVLKPIADKYHIYFGTNKGYSSAVTIYDLAKRLKSSIEAGKKCVVLYMGDHDPSGLDMIRDIKERVEEFLTEGEEYTDPEFEVVQLALNMEQIRHYNPPPNPAKITDPRATWYISEHGKTSWELDALNPEVLRDIAEAGVQEHIDIDKYNKWVRKEDEHKRELKVFAKKLTKKEK